MITFKQAQANYNKSKDYEFESEDKLLERISLLSELGQYSIEVYIDSHRKLLEVMQLFVNKGFSAHHHGNNTSTLRITWA